MCNLFRVKDVISQTPEQLAGEDSPGPQPSLGGVDEDVADHDVEEVDNDEAALGASEDVIRSRQKLNAVATIANLRFQPVHISRHHIPLCRMVVMPMVRPTLSCDLTKLEEEFVHGYRDGAAVFYVSLTNEQGDIQEVSEEDKVIWGPLWDEENEKFNKYLRGIPEMQQYVNRMFFVCDGNHRRIAWMNHIERLHKNEPSWHYSVDAIILDTKGRIGLVMQVMHDINK
jgi:hypothetical protein